MSFSRNFIFQFPSHAVEMLFERDDVSVTKIINRFDFVYKLYSLVCRVRINAQLVLQTSIKRVRESERARRDRESTDERTDGRMDGFLISRLSTMILSDSLRILTAPNLRDRDSARHSSNSRLLVPPLPSFRFRCLTNPLLSSPLLSLPPPPGPDIQ